MDIVSPKTALHHTATLRRMQGWLLDILMNRSLALLNKVHRAELTAKFVQKKAKASRSCVSTAVVKRPRKNIPHKSNRLTKKKLYMVDAASFKQSSSLGFSIHFSGL